MIHAIFPTPHMLCPLGPFVRSFARRSAGAFSSPLPFVRIYTSLFLRYAPLLPFALGTDASHRRTHTLPRVYLLNFLEPPMVYFLSRYLSSDLSSTHRTSLIQRMRSSCPCPLLFLFTTSLFTSPFAYSALASTRDCIQHSHLLGSNCNGTTDPRRAHVPPHLSASHAAACERTPRTTLVACG